MNFDAAARQAARSGLEAMLAVRDGETVFEWYGPGFDANVPHALYSGTKSFWGTAAVAAQEDGLLELDEPVAATFSEWNVGSRARVTLRHLLQLTSGIGSAGSATRSPSTRKPWPSN